MTLYRIIAVSFRTCDQEVIACGIKNQAAAEKLAARYSPELNAARYASWRIEPYEETT